MQSIMILHISHGAKRSDDPSDVDWFVVKPLTGEMHNPSHVDAVNSLLHAGRTVYELDTEFVTAIRINKEMRIRG